MSARTDEWRRWLGLFFLALAGAMVVWGQTLLRPRLAGLVFLAYWLGCFLLTLAAMAAALLDVRATWRRARREREDLLRHTLDTLDSELHRRSGPEDSKPGRADPPAAA